MATLNPTTVVYESLKEKILKGVYSPAENLPEVELANTYRVSRNTIKKALLMLESENLVTIERNKGAKVRSYSMVEVLEYLELRSALEGFIVRLAVPVFTESQLRQMEQILAAMKENKESHALMEYSNNNQRFHQVIYDACPNRTTVELTINLKNQMRKYNTKTILIPGRDVQSFAEHSAILDAIRNRDAELADTLMQHHITNVRKTFEENYSLLF